MEDIEEELFGDFPYTPQWEAIQQRLIEESTEVPSVYRKVEEDSGQSDFFKDFADGFI